MSYADVVWMRRIHDYVLNLVVSNPLLPYALLYSQIWPKWRVCGSVLSDRSRVLRTGYISIDSSQDGFRVWIWNQSSYNSH